MAHAVLQRLRSERVARLDAGELAALLALSCVLRQEETGMTGPIRILAVGGEVVVQEQTPAGEVMARLVATDVEAGALVDGRLATYERMWNGCGCRIDYER